MAKKRFEETEKVLDVNAAIQGTVVFKDPVNLRINGDFTGQLDTKGALTIGADAHVQANITGDTITIAGTLEGNVKASERLIVVAPAKIIGDIETPVLSVSEGAIIDGFIRMTTNGAANDRLLSVDEVARYLEVENAVLMEWAKTNKIPARYENNEWKFTRREVDEWIQREKVKV